MLMNFEEAHMLYDGEFRKYLAEKEEESKKEKVGINNTSLSGMTQRNTMQFDIKQAVGECEKKVEVDDF